MSAYEILPTEDVRPRRRQGAAANDDFYAERPRTESSALSDAPAAERNRPIGGATGFVPEEFANQFRAFDEDSFFRDSRELAPSGNVVRRESARSSTVSEVPQQSPVPGPIGGPAPQRPARRGFWGTVGRSIGRALGAVTGAVSSGFRRLFGGRARAAQPAAAPAPVAQAGAASFEYEEGLLGNVFQGDQYALPARRKGIPAEAGMLGRAANAATRDANAGQANGRPGSAGNGRSLLTDAANEMSAAIAMQPRALQLQRAMAMQQANAPRVKSPLPANGAHDSSESALGARFDAMEDDDEAEDLLPRNAEAQNAPTEPEQSRESFLREQEIRQAGLPVIPNDMADFPGADILYQPQRRRVHL